MSELADKSFNKVAVLLASCGFLYLLVALSNAVGLFLSYDEHFVGYSDSIRSSYYEVSYRVLFAPMFLGVAALVELLDRLIWILQGRRGDVDEV